MVSYLEKENNPDMVIPSSVAMFARKVLERTENGGIWLFGSSKGYPIELYVKLSKTSTFLTLILTLQLFQ